MGYAEAEEADAIDRRDAIVPAQEASAERMTDDDFEDTFDTW